LSRIILHVDVDAFFASVEQVVHPEWRGKPVIVGGRADDRSVVASASYEARARGVKTAMPIAAAHRRCPEGVFLRGTYHLYEEFSERLEAILREFSPLVQKASLDDFYLDLTGGERLLGPPLEAAECAKLRIRNETGLNVSMGLGANRLIAKIASERAKPNGIIAIRVGYEAAFLRPLEADVIPGVGRQTLERLHKFNLRTVGDLAGLDRALLERTFGRKGAELWEHARGEDHTPVTPAGPPKTISRETTFERDTDDRRRLEAMLYYLTERATQYLRALGMQARGVEVKVRYSDFETALRSRTLPQASDQDEALYAMALELMRGLLARRMRIRLIGVGLSGLCAIWQHQSDVWTERAFARKRRLYRSLDEVRRRFGFGSVTAGPALRLLKELDQDDQGFRLRTSCLSR